MMGGNTIMIYPELPSFVTRPSPSRREQLRRQNEAMAAETAAQNGKAKGRFHGSYWESHEEFCKVVPP